MKNKLLLYYSATGNTKAVANMFDDEIWDKIRVKMDTVIDWEKYDTIVIGTSTWGRGVPPDEILRLRVQLRRLRGKRVGLFGSGRVEFLHYCGALDLLETMMKRHNDIIFKFGYEGYPRVQDFARMEEYIEKIHSVGGKDEVTEA